MQFSVYGEPDHTDKNSRGDVLSEDNAQAVTDILHAVNKCASVLRDAGKYYRDMEQDLNDLTQFIAGSPPPSDEEVEIVRSRWAEFLAASVKVLLEVGDLRISLSHHPYLPRGEDIPSYSATTGESLKGTNAPVPLKTIQGASAPAQPRVSLLRRLLSRLTSRSHNSVNR